MAELQHFDTVPKDVQVGDVMAFVQFVKVKDKKDKNGTQLTVENLYPVAPLEFDVNGAPLVEKAFSADRFSKTEKLSNTDIVKIMVSLYNRPFTVNFQILHGEERTFRCRLLGEVEHMGYSLVEVFDLDKDPKKRIREVNHRHLNWLVTDGVKYTSTSKHSKPAKKDDTKKEKATAAA